MKLLSLSLCLIALAACGGRESFTPSQTWLQTDKHLTCDQLLLEMNDATFWNQAAQKNRSMGLTDVFNPVGYMNSRSSANEAEAKTSERLKHLNNIYKIKGCAKPYADMP